MITDDSFSLLFNSTKLSSFFYVEDIRGRGVIGQEVELIEIPGMDGAHVSGTKIKARPIEVDVAFVLNSDSELRKVIETVNGLLLTKEVKPLQFEDELDRTYQAITNGVQETFEWGGVHRATIIFLCPDPYKYGREKDIEFVNAARIDVEGTAETEPIIKCRVKEDTTFIAVSNGTDINIVGNYTQAGEQPHEPETRVFWNEMGALTGWTTSTSVEEGSIAGSMKSNGYEFYTDDYGTGTGWRGPAIKTSIGEAIQDFKIDVLLSQMGSSGQVGSIEIALLDANNRFVTKMLLSKRIAHNQANYARIRAGTYANGYNIIDDRGAADWVWAYFDGLMRIMRVGNHWAVYVAKIDENGKHHSTMYRAWDDIEGISTAPITQVQVQLWKFGDIPATNQRVKDIKVFRVNPQSEGVPVIARAGDIVEFNHREDIITKNGENITKEKMFIGNYFTLEPGDNQIVVEPAEAIDLSEVRWREKWL